LFCFTNRNYCVVIVLITDIFDEESFGFDDENEFKVSVLTKKLKNLFLMPFERDMYDEYHDLMKNIKPG
jgi:hypothetical protein